MHGKHIFAFMQMARQVDQVSNSIINHHMCEEKLCPCLDYHTSYDSSTTTKDVFMALDPVKVARRRHNVPFYFTNDTKVGFKSFDQCYAYWDFKSYIDKSIDVKKLFKTPWVIKDGIGQLYH